MLSIPGSSEYFGNKIKEITDAEIEGTSRAHSGQRGWYGETLAQLPSPETVKVLGELLFDERDPFQGSSTDAPWSATCWMAEDAIFRLGISNPPVAPGEYPHYKEDLHTWQLWYEQVKAGRRTFSFKGDGKVYTLAGPVKDAVDPETNSKRRAEPPVAAAAQPVAGPRWGLWAAVFAALLAGVVAVVWGRGRRGEREPGALDEQRISFPMFS